MLAGIDDLEYVKMMTIKGVIVQCPLAEQEVFYYIAVIRHKQGHYLAALGYLQVCLQVNFLIPT